MLSAGTDVADNRQERAAQHTHIWHFFFFIFFLLVQVLPHLLIEMLLCPGRCCCCVCLAPGACSYVRYVLTGGSGPS